MAYVYICTACRDGRHEECEDRRGRGFGVGICVCSHSEETRDAFEQSVWDGGNV